MKKQINRISSKIVLAIVIAGLAVALSLPRLSAMTSVSAQTAGRHSGWPAGLQGEAAIQSLKEQGLYDSLQEAVAAARYEVCWEDAPARGALPPAYRAPNPAQQYDAYFTPNGLNLAPRKAAPIDVESAVASGETAQSAEPPEWQASMQLIGYGYGESLLSVGFPELAARGNRIEYRRDWPPITEWYVNKPAGLEQGFTIVTPPGARAEGEPLRLVLELTGDLSAELIGEGQAIVLRQANGELALTYSDLHAYDALERELPSQMRMSEGRVILEVDDETATYPLKIDPVFNQRPALTSEADGEAFDNFGHAVAIYSDTVVIGVPFDDVTSGGLNKVDQGSAFVFKRINGNWSRVTQLFALSSDAASGDHFGKSVAIYWDTIVVGAPGAGSIGAGKAFVFRLTNGTWSQVDKLSPSMRNPGDLIDQSVAINNAYTIVVGAPHQATGAANFRGAIFVFTPNGAIWSEQARLLAGDGMAGDEFGTSVAINENNALQRSIVVGAPFDDVVVNNVTRTDQGSAYVFLSTDGLNWSQQARLNASDGATGDRFGFSVGITVSRSRIIVGAPLDDVVVNNVARTDQGSAYLFQRNGSFWSQEIQLTASDGAANDNYGHSVAISGYEVVVGAPFDDVYLSGVNRVDRGSAYT